MRKLIPLLAALAFLFSCTTFTSTEGPEWTRETPHPAGMVVFVGSGTGADESTARAAAYLDILSRMDSDLGYDVVTLYYRELLSTNAIASLDARITSTYTAPANEGSAYFAMIEIPEETYYSSRSEEYAAALERTDKINALMDEALESYKANQDTKALDLVLSALDLSLSGTVTGSQYTPERLLEQAMGYLENIGITISPDASGTDVSVRMQRMRGIFHPDVVDGLVDVRYAMITGEGDTIESSVILKTGSNGSARFFRTNPYMLWNGTLRFSVAVSSSVLSSIEAKAPAGFLDPLHALLDASSVTYSYEERGRYAAASTVIAVSEYGEDGLQLEMTPACTAFSSYLNAAETGGYTAVPVEGDEEADVLENLRAMFPGMDNYIVLRVGIADSESGGGREYVRTEARLSFYDAESAKPHTVRDLFAIGVGVSESEAGEASLARCGEAAAAMFLSEL